MGSKLSPPPPTIKTSVKIRDLKELYFLSLWRITVKLKNFTNFKALFPVVSTDFP